MITSNLGPTDSDLLLLRVITSPLGDVQARWEAWTKSVDIDVLSPAAYGLLPALYRTIMEAGVTHPWVARLRGVYRRQWTESQHHLAATEALGVTLSSAGIDFLTPADQQVSRFLDEPATQQLGRPRVAVSWWSAPDALDALTSAGWRIGAEGSRAWSLRARLTRTNWTISSDVGGTASLVNFFDPWLVDERRDNDVWERARASQGSRLPDASPNDVAVAALTDQLDLAGAVRWALGSAAVLAAIGEQVDLHAVLDRQAARRALPVIVSRLQLMVGEGLGSDTERLLSEAEELAALYGLPTTMPRRAADWGQRRVRAVARRPSAAREIVGRHGGLAGVRDYLARY